MPTPEPAPALRQVNVDSGRNHLSAGGGKFRGEVLREAGGGGGGEAWQVRGRALPGPGSGIVLTSVGMRCSSVKVDDQDYWATTPPTAPVPSGCSPPFPSCSPPPPEVGGLTWWLSLLSLLPAQVTHLLAPLYAAVPSWVRSQGAVLPSQDCGSYF